MGSKLNWKKHINGLDYAKTPDGTIMCRFFNGTLGEVRFRGHSKLPDDFFDDTANFAEVLFKTCFIINGTSTWLLKVDGVEVPFSGGANAEYFKELYTKMGYTVVIKNEVEQTI